jgi:hypothetical protein
MSLQRIAKSAGAFDGGARDLQGLHLCELRLDRSQIVMRLTLDRLPIYTWSS